MFAHVLDICQSNGLLRGRAIGTDSSSIDANASMDSLHHKELGCSYEDYMLAMKRQDAPVDQQPLILFCCDCEASYLHIVSNAKTIQKPPQSDSPA